ncbi:hypothetical protein Cme02nite_58120 [Catellatospora methionotrophica]|uniref:Uncharacterized protein n=1 Tax=Catellatospora methionotrophica TaxID=121620 RepID=A0A8J3LFN2_9ACTN|nr:hypothetical protein [Catellatospora methionotrophica]GIG17480.1 hypothetical protein Cme02nite_58120 [Catellatospora methionotrophica]
MSGLVTHTELLDRVARSADAGDFDAAASSLVALRRSGGAAGGDGLRPLLDLAAGLPPAHLQALLRALLRLRRADRGWHADSVIGALCPLLPGELPPDLVAELLAFAEDSSYDIPVMTLAKLVALHLRHAPLPPAVLATVRRRERESLWLRELAATAAARSAR